MRNAMWVVGGITGIGRIPMLGAVKMSQEGDIGDEHWDNVVALLHFDGDLTDETGRSWTLGSASKINSSTPIFGSGSLETTGLGDGVYTSNPISDTSTPFTVETYVEIIDLPPPQNGYGATDWMAFWSQNENSDNGEYGLWMQGDLFILDLRTSGGGVNGVTLPTPLVINKRYHLAHTFDGTTHRAFLDGVLLVSVNHSNGWPNTSQPFRIGQMYVPSYNQYRSGGYCLYDSFRITKGVARYTTNFTPPDAPFPSY